ncbi:TPA: hypothetical protein ACFNMZ_000441 [Neisseria polysaccharea]
MPPDEFPLIDGLKLYAEKAKNHSPITQNPDSLPLARMSFTPKA